MKKFLRNKNQIKKVKEIVKGDDLVDDFTTALVSRSTASVAHNEAMYSVRATEDILKETRPSNSIFITPQDIPKDIRDSLAKASLDAQFKKIQSAQISSKTIELIQQMNNEAIQKYKNKKILVTILEPENHPVQSYWKNSKTGRVTTGVIRGKSIKGIVYGIDFNSNLLLIIPTRLSRTFNPDRKYIAAYVINPETLQPMISITIT